MQKLADHIHKSSGPSGMNKDYLWNLETALDDLSLESGDEHVKDLSQRVRKIEDCFLDSSKENFRQPEELRLKESDEQEETEK